MPHPKNLFFGIVISLTFITTFGCSSQAKQVASRVPADTSLPAAVVAGDPCSQENITIGLTQYTTLMQEFDDASFLAQSTPQGQLAIVILEMQRVRRKVEALEAPVCLVDLKTKQISAMNGVIVTMTSFLGGQSSGDLMQRQISLSRELRMAYDAEVSQLSGIPYTTPTALPTLTPTTVIPTSTASPITATTKTNIYVLKGPAVGYPAVGVLLENQRVNVVGRLAGNQWVMIELFEKPGEYGWVLITSVQISGSVNKLPLATPEPVQ